MSKRTQQVIVSVMSVLLLVAVWWMQSGDDDSGEAGRDGATQSASQGAATSQDAATGDAGGAAARDDHGLPWVAVSDLPPEASETLELIDDGGPFPHDKDGSTFGNFEGILPDRARGYYAEYTVETPGLSHRGARRIVTGDGGEFYWTADHYESFERIRR